MSVMRAKMKVLNVTTFSDNSERVSFTAVCKKEGYDASGEDENNTYAKWTPSADSFLIVNPALFGQFKEGEEYYLDFTKAGE